MHRTAAELASAAIVENGRPIEPTAEQLALFIEGAPAAIAMFDRRMRYLAASRRMITDLRLPPETQLIGRSHYEVFPDVPQRWRDIHERVLSGETLSATEDPFPRADGSTDWIRWEMRPWHTPDGAIGGAMLFSEVITGEVEARLAREGTEAELARSEARFRAAVQAVHGILWTNDAEGRMVGEQPGWAALTGQSQADYEGFGWSRAVHPDDAQPTVEAWLDAVRERRPFVFEHRLRRADGAWRRFAIRAIPVFDADGQIQEWVGVHTDVTAERDAETRLQQSEARLRAIFEAVPVGLVIAEAPAGRIVEGNRQVEEVFGHPVLPSQDIEAYREWVSHHPDGRQVLGHEYPLSLALRGQAERPELEVLYERGDGREAWIRLVAAPIRNELSEVTGAVVACLDVDGERRAREALARLNRSLEAEVAERTADRDRMWRLTTDLMLVAGMDATIHAVNPRWSTLLGWREEELVGAEFMGFVHPEDRDATLAEVGRLADGATTFRFENRYRSRDGGYRWISWIAVPSEGLIHAAGRDITQEKEAAAELARAQDALRQSQKLESMGQLTGGVAHDFNNLLTPVIGSLDMLQRRGIGGERERRLIDGALQSAERAKVLVQRLLAFARRQPLQAVPVELGSLIEGMADLIGSTSGPQIRLAMDLQPNLPHVLADPNQLEMAILNLAVNARDAMPHGGALTFSAEAATVTRPDKDQPPPGRYVRLRIADTGHGMDEATLARAIEPFFSTKGLGRGTGLGLSMVHGLAAQLGGALTLRSRPNAGTAVDLWLPIAAEAVALDNPVPPEFDTRGAGVVLLVDDENVVRMTTAEMLTELGYKVIEATSAEEALTRLDEGVRIDVLVTDHLMPGKTGAELAQEIRNRLPATRVLVISGYAQEAGLPPDIPRLTKPFRRGELAAALTDEAEGARRS